MWESQGKCANDPELIQRIKANPEMNDLFFNKSLIKEAKEYCSDCPVKVQCFQAGLVPSQTNLVQPGVWGGQSERERRKYLRDRVKKAAMLQARMEELLQGASSPIAS